MLALSRDDLRALVPMRTCIDLVKDAFAELHQGRAVVPLRLQVDVAAGQDTMLVMPAFMEGVPALGFKVVSVFRSNASRDLPVTNAMVCMVDPETGVPAAVLNGSYLTQLRTGAGSGASAELMSRKDSRHLVVIGSGRQAVTQAAAVAAVRDLEKITVVYRSSENWDRFRADLAADWPDLTELIAGTEDAESAVRSADIVCLATSSSTPVFEDAWVGPGTHVSGVGSFTPAMQEAPAEFVARARVVVDMKEHALEEAGDLIQPLQDGTIVEGHIVGELGELVLGTVQGRTSDDEATFFKSVGNAVQDMIVGAYAVNEARKRGIGQDIDLG